VKSEDATKELIKYLDIARKTSNEVVPKNRDTAANMVQATIGLLKSQEYVLSSLDRFIGLVEKSPLDAKVFDDFIKYRDLIRDLIRVLKLKINIDKEYIDTLDAILWWASKNQSKLKGNLT